MLYLIQNNNEFICLFLCLGKITIPLLQNSQLNLQAAILARNIVETTEMGIQSNAILSNLFNIQFNRSAFW